MTWYETFYIAVQGLALASWIALPLGLWLVKNVRVKKIFLGVVLVINAGLFGFILQDKNQVPTVSNVVVKGDFWDIETVFNEDSSLVSRRWKRNTLEELSTNLNHYRVSQNLTPVKQEVIESFSPQQLNTLLNEHPGTVQLLDVREAYELSGYSLRGATAFRYGDLVNNQVPGLDKNKRVVVICYSGIRGYLVANLLKSLGFGETAFIRGGLEAWNEQELPAVGDYDAYEFLGQVYDRLDFNEMTNSYAAKIDFRLSSLENINRAFSNLKLYNGELAPSTTVKAFVESLSAEPVLLLCETESECYDARNFAYAYEQAGGSVLGYYKF